MAGFSLLELMVAAVIAMVGAVTIFQTMSVSEERRRSTTSGSEGLQLWQVADTTDFREQVLRKAAVTGLDIPDSHFRAVELQQPAIVGSQLILASSAGRRSPEVSAGGFIKEPPFAAGLSRGAPAVRASFNQQQPASAPDITGNAQYAFVPGRQPDRVLLLRLLIFLDEFHLAGSGPRLKPRCAAAVGTAPDEFVKQWWG